MATETYHCIQCKVKTSKGRFARPGISSGWSQRRHIPMWMCFKCFPEGTAAGEEQNMPRKAATPATSEGMTTTIPKDYVAEHDKIVVLIPSLQTEVAELTVTTAEEYAYADSLLGRIDLQRKGWGAVWDRIQEKTIKPLRSALDGLYEVNRSIDKPLETLREAVRAKMTSYKVEEARAIREAERVRAEDEARLKREADEAAKKAEAAATPQMRGRLLAKAESLNTWAAAAAAKETPLPAVGVSSGTRTVPKLRIKNWEQFLQAAMEDETVRSTIPMAETEAAINKLWKVDEDVALWPGVEKYDHITVTGR